jgi:hypothetical protein
LLGAKRKERRDDDDDAVVTIMIEHRTAEGWAKQQDLRRSARRMTDRGEVISHSPPHFRDMRWPVKFEITDGKTKCAMARWMPIFHATTLLFLAFSWIV